MWFLSQAMLCSCRLGALVLFFFALVTDQAFSETMYLVSGVLTRPGDDSVLATNLYAVAAPSTKLALIRNLLSKDDPLAAVHYSSKYRVMTLISGSESLVVTVLSMAEPGRSLSFSFDPEHRTVMSSNLLDIPGRGLVQSFYLAGKKMARLEPLAIVPGAILEGELVGFDVAGSSSAAGNPAVLSSDDLRYVTATGYPGAVVYAGDEFHASFSDKGYLASREALRTVPLSLRTPVPPQFSRKGFVKTAIASDDLIAVMLVSGESSGNGRLGYTDLLLYERRTEQWSSIRVPGNQAWVRAFGSWLGIVISENTHRPGSVTSPQPRDISEGSPASNSARSGLTFEDSPGVNQPQRRRRDPGTSVLQRLAYFETYAPGQLVIYDGNSHRSYSIDTNDGDSEILLIGNGSVYYRVYDSIFQRAIEGEALGKPSLVAQDPAVVDVHWAFWQ